MIDKYKRKINGLHYVREIKNEQGERGGYLLIDNNNKPVKQVYTYLLRCKKRDGYEINTLKRICYDLQHFYDYMLLNELSPELITYKEFYDFINEYLKVLDPNIKIYDCIERSMLTRVPILTIYDTKFDDNIIILNPNKVEGLKVESIKRIADNAKKYLIYLKFVENIEIDIDNIFSEIIISVNKENQLLSHVGRKRLRIFTTNNILRASGIIVKNRNYIEPITYNRVFEDNEMNSFFYAIKQNKNIMYHLFFYLLRITGARISEIRALQIWHVPSLGLSVDYSQLGADIKLIDKETRLWRIDIRIRNDNPTDLQIKGNEERSIDIIDGQGILEHLLNQSLMYRKYILRKKRKDCNFLFINRNGKRFLNARLEQVFKETMIKAKLQDRCGRNQLVPHSFRHTYSSKFIQNLDTKNFERGLILLSKQLGHKTTETTRKTYIHFFKDDYITILESLERSSKI